MESRLRIVKEILSSYYETRVYLWLNHSDLDNPGPDPIKNLIRFFIGIQTF